MKSLKVALYVRTSTDEQHPENQLIELREYAQKRGFEIYKEYSDIISSVKKSRPSLDLLMQDARAKHFSIVIVWKLDRLGRSLQHLIQIIQELQNKNINLICTTQNIDTTTATGTLIFHIFGAIAEFERELIRERIKLSIKRMKKEGKILGRPIGSKDKTRRRKSGYILRYANEWKSKFEKELNIYLPIDYFINNGVQIIKKEFKKRKSLLNTPS